MRVNNIASLKKNLAAKTHLKMDREVACVDLHLARGAGVSTGLQVA